jgi:hypothetical protein
MLALFAGAAGAAFATGRFAAGFAFSVVALGFAYHAWSGLR